MRAPHDIIHTITSFPWRKVAKASGTRAPMNWGHMINMSLRVAMTHIPPSQWRLYLVSQKVSMDFIRMVGDENDNTSSLIGRKSLGISFIACPWLMTCSWVPMLKTISS